MRPALVPMALAGLCSLGQAAAEPAAPEAVLDYYRRHNFATAFSTREERQLLAEKPETPNDPRLMRVAKMMQQLEGPVDYVDRGIVQAGGHSPLAAVRSDLLRIKRIRLDDAEDELRVELEALSLEPDANVYYVARFEELTKGDRTPGVEELLALRAGKTLLARTEVHHWRRVDGAWRRVAATMHFLAK